MKFFLIAVLVAVASAQDDGSYRPEHHGGDYSHQGVAYRHNSGRYVHTVERTVPVQPVVRVAPAVPAVPAVPVVSQRVQPVPPVPQFPTAARTYTNEGRWQVLRDAREQSPVGDYVYEYETENGIKAREQVQAVAPQSQRGQGFYEYTSPEGQLIRVDYTADENGFQATGAHLPVAPAVPAAIQRSVEYQLRLARL